VLVESEEQKRTMMTSITLVVTAMLTKTRGRVCRPVFSIGYVYFSVIEAGTTITPHHGPTNAKLRAHLPLVLPTGEGDKRGSKIMMLMLPNHDGEEGGDGGSDSDNRGDDDDDDLPTLTPAAGEEAIPESACWLTVGGETRQ
jgi:hypothetical protein